MSGVRVPGAKHALMVALLVQAALLLSAMATSRAGAAAPYLYMLWVGGEHLCFAAAFVVLPVATAFHFGIRPLAANYGLLMSAQVRLREPRASTTMSVRFCCFAGSHYQLLQI